MFSHRLSAELTAKRAPTAVDCPRCHSCECRSNRIPNLTLDEIFVNAWAEFQAGHSRKALRAIFGWVCVEVANKARASWLCQYCGHHFS